MASDEGLPDSAAAASRPLLTWLPQRGDSITFTVATLTYRLILTNTKVRCEPSATVFRTRHNERDSPRC